MSNNGTDTVRFIKDPHGNVVATSKNNSITDSYDYTAFGVQINSAETSNPFRYCGEYYDEELDSVYLRNRYYQPTIGRFITEDPVKDGLNWYNYCAGNPVMMIDPSGLIKVLLRNAIENNGGTVEWDNETQTATVTMNINNKDITKTYSGEIINGRMIVDSEVLEKDFDKGESGIYEIKNGDKFYSSDDASMAFGFALNEESINIDKEYGAIIYHMSDGTYEINGIVLGEKGFVPGERYIFDSQKEVDSIVHTHGAYQRVDPDGIFMSYENDTFSDADIAFAKEHNANSYVATPGGYLRYVDKTFKIQGKGLVNVNDTILITDKLPKQFQ